MVRKSSTSQTSDRNPVYGTSRKWLQLFEVSPEPNARDRSLSVEATRISSFVTQNPDGGWGGEYGCTLERSKRLRWRLETMLLSDPYWNRANLTAEQGLLWLIERVENGTYREPTPIGFYFAKLWYFESLYPLIFTVAALRRACETSAEAEP